MASEVWHPPRRCIEQVGAARSSDILSRSLPDYADLEIRFWPEFHISAPTEASPTNRVVALPPNTNAIVVRPAATVLRMVDKFELLEFLATREERNPGVSLHGLTLLSEVANLEPDNSQARNNVTPCTS
jgi:hypothetical protein